MSITAKELAEKLGISASAVSIALNGKKGISDEKRDFILRAAKEYGLKRPLRKSFSSTFINLVIFKKHGMVYGDTPFFAAVTEGISAEVANSGYNLQISYFYGRTAQVALDVRLCRYYSVGNRNGTRRYPAISDHRQTHCRTGLLF